MRAEKPHKQIDKLLAAVVEPVILLLVHQKNYPLSLQAHQSEPQAAATFSQGKRLQPVNTVRWYYRTFQGAPDLVRELLPGSAAATNALGFDTAAAGSQA